MTKLNPRAAGDVEEAYYRELGAGRRCLFWYSDDTVWHEALIGLVVGPEHAVIFTPDGDLYVEKISCQGEEGPARMKGLLPNLNLPRNLRARAYRFKEAITDQLIRTVFRDSLALARSEGWEVEIPDEIWNERGVKQDLNSMFGGTFVENRVGRKGHQKTPQVEKPATPANALVARPAMADYVWLAAEPKADLVLGQEISISPEVDVQCGTHDALILRKGIWVKAEMIRLEDASDYAERRRKLFQSSAIDGIVASSKEVVKPSDDEKDGDVRTLWVDYDEHGERFKRWRDVVKESYTPTFEEKPLDGPATALHIMKHAERHGGDPRLWLNLWLRSKHIEMTDRTYHEMKVLVDALYYGGTFDQLNIPALMCMETICRRLQAIVDAYTNPNRPSWENAKIFAGQGSPEDIVSPTFRTYAAKKNKDELELLQARQKVRELRGSPVVAVDDGEHGDALPVKPPKGPKAKVRPGKPAAGQVDG